MIWDIMCSDKSLKEDFMITILSNRAIPIIMLLCSAKNTDTVDINIKSTNAYSGKRFFQNIRRSVASVDWGGNPTSIKVV